MPRAVVVDAPPRVLYAREPIPVGLLACNGYADYPALLALARSPDAALSWWSPARCLVVRTRAGGRWRTWEPFAEDYPDAASFREFLRDAAAVGCPLPTSYGSLARALAPSLYTAMQDRAGWSDGVGHFVRGGWQASFTRGYQPGRFRRYDLCSAYLWAGLMALPDMATVRYWAPGDKIKRRGLYIADVEPSTDARALYPYRVGGRVAVAGGDVLDGLVAPVRYFAGLTWAREYPARELRALYQTPWGKRLGRAYWGAWSGERGPRIERGGVRPDVVRWSANPFRNALAAHCIQWQVRRRLADVAPRAVAVYVDAVVTAERLPTGTAPGEWVRKDVYPDGVDVGPGGLVLPPLRGHILKHRILHGRGH